MAGCLQGVVILKAELHYELPAELIARRPCEPRDGSRLMVVDRARGSIEHRRFRDVVDYLRPADCLVLNRTRVLPAKFRGQRETGGRIEGIFVAEERPGIWRVMLKGSGRLREGETIGIGEGYRLRLERRLERGECEMRVEPVEAAVEVLGRIGSMPLPPYIDRESEDCDFEQYQTVYGDAPGAIAAPTAGLHFTHELLEKVRAGGVSIAECVLHVGLGTFQPIEVDELSAHVMHREWYSLPSGSAERIRAARSAGGRCVAVGTTSVRVLESSSAEGSLKSGEGWTNLFIYPPYEFRAVDMLITNFHLPGSTLLALVGAWMGMPLMRRVYATAIEERYRFYSYGDAMLIV